MQVEAFRIRPFLGYSLAILAWLVAFGLRQGLTDLIGRDFPFIAFVPAVALVAWFAGTGPSALTALLSGVTAWWFWLGEDGFDLGGMTIVALLSYAFIVVLDILFIARLRAALQRISDEKARNKALIDSRDLLLKEVQHRVSNNVHTVSALLRLGARTTTDPDARRVLDQAMARTAMIARLQRHLLESAGKATPFEILARELTRETLLVAGRSDVSITLSCDGLALTSEEATPVMLILLECVNNALEHAIPDTSGTIEICFEQTRTERILTVRDSGPGPQPDLQVDQSQSMGLRITTGLARQLGGHFSMTPGHPGCICRLEYPRPFTV